MSWNGSSTCPYPSTGAASLTFTSALQFFAAAQCLIPTENWPPDADVCNYEEFNYIVIGAGTAGSIVANRLSENKNKKVLVIEAGGDPPAESIIPSMYMKLIGTKYDWHYEAITDKRTQKAYKNNMFFWPRGKFLGGCSSINGMAYFKGCSGDYEKWKEAGNEDWSSEIASQYSKKAESLQNQHMLQNPAIKASYGKNGLLTLNRFNNSYCEIYDCIMDAWHEIGIKRQEDLNSAKYLNGCGVITVNAADGVRQSTAKTYLVPARDRPNLKVMKNTLVTKILINNITMNAYGVEALRNNRTLTLKAKDEVIVCGGTVKTPQLLMVSGIGPKTHLETKNIKVLVDSPMVGQNLLDHVEILITIYGKGPRKIYDNTKHFDAIQYLFDRTGNLVLNASDITAFYSKTNNTTCPEYQNHFSVYYQNDSDTVRSLFSSYYNLNDTVVNSIVELNKNYTLYLFRFVLLHQFSKGNLSLKSNNPREHPVIYPNYMSDPRDVDSAVKGIKMISSRITKTSYFKSIGAFLGRLSWRPCNGYELDSDDYWKCICRHMVLPFYHQTGTAKMGPDIKTSVVDSKLRVHGVRKLRCVDASVIPSTISVNSLGPVVMVAERAADLIKGVRTPGRSAHTSRFDTVAVR